MDILILKYHYQGKKLNLNIFGKIEDIGPPHVELHN